MPNCDCGTCCDACGHYPGCISQEVPACGTPNCPYHTRISDPSDDYTA